MDWPTPANWEVLSTHEQRVLAAHLLVEAATNEAEWTGSHSFNVRTALDYVGRAFDVHIELIEVKAGFRW